MPTSQLDSFPIIISMGDPGGVGPETILKSLNRLSYKKLSRIVIVGDLSILSQLEDRLKLKYTVRSRGSATKPCVHIDDVKFFTTKKPKRHVHPLNGKASVAYLDRALLRVRQTKNASLITAPVCKKSIQLSGDIEFTGHTSLLARKTNSKNVIMSFIGKKLKVALFTEHIPLNEVSSQITKKKLSAFLQALDGYIVKHWKIKHPRIAVAGVNPHAGEGGTIGREEEDVVRPVISKSKKMIYGPIPGDVIFYEALHGKYDFIVCMYHDQALSAFKMLYRDSGVNLTLGLPFIRTSPDHGTAFDIADKCIANETSMYNSINLAIKLTNN